MLPNQTATTSTSSKELRPVLHEGHGIQPVQMGLDMIQGDHEDAPGQLELNTGCIDDVLRNADRLSTYRQICAQVAREFGI